MAATALTHLPFDSSWCPVCSRQILPKRIQIPVGAAALQQMQQQPLPPTTPAPPPSPTTSSEYPDSFVSWLILNQNVPRSYLDYADKEHRVPHSRRSRSRNWSRQVQRHDQVLDQDRTTCSCSSAATIKTPPNPYRHRPEPPSPLLLRRLPSRRPPIIFRFNDGHQLPPRSPLRSYLSLPPSSTT